MVVARCRYGCLAVAVVVPCSRAWGHHRGRVPFPGKSPPSVALIALRRRFERVTMATYRLQIIRGGDPPQTIWDYMVYVHRCAGASVVVEGAATTVPIEDNLTGAVPPWGYGSVFSPGHLCSVRSPGSPPIGYYYIFICARARVCVAQKGQASYRLTGLALMNVSFLSCVISPSRTIFPSSFSISFFHFSVVADLIWCSEDFISPYSSIACRIQYRGLSVSAAAKSAVSSAGRGCKLFNLVESKRCLRVEDQLCDSVSLEYVVALVAGVL